jgi:hypothetical protein
MNLEDIMPKPDNSIPNMPIPDGDYDGIRGGYDVVIDGITYKSNNGIRGRNFPCQVRVTNGVGQFMYKGKPLP